jgi:hypothetical protein
MRVTIEIDEKSGNVATTAATPSGSAGSQTAETVSAAPVLTPPPDVLAIAAATGAINGGPAPDTSGSTASAPHPFQSRGGAMSEVAHAAAISGGAASKV